MTQSRILLVGRDPDFVIIYGRVLQYAGHAVTVARDPDQVVEIAAAARPDVVVVELPTPTASGRPVTESLRADARTADLRVLGITAGVTERELARARRAGATRVLPMPVAPMAVVAEVDTVLAAS